VAGQRDAGFRGFVSGLIRDGGFTIGGLFLTVDVCSDAGASSFHLDSWLGETFNQKRKMLGKGAEKAPKNWWKLTKINHR
jgi:hypothetical protein